MGIWKDGRWMVNQGNGWTSREMMNKHGWMGDWMDGWRDGWIDWLMVDNQYLQDHQSKMSLSYLDIDWKLCQIQSDMWIWWSRELNSWLRPWKMKKSEEKRWEGCSSLVSDGWSMIFLILLLAFPTLNHPQEREHWRKPLGGVEPHLPKHLRDTLNFSCFVLFWHSVAHHQHRLLWHTLNSRHLAVSGKFSRSFPADLEWINYVERSWSSVILCFFLSLKYPRVFKALLWFLTVPSYLTQYLLRSTGCKVATIIAVYFCVIIYIPQNSGVLF